MKLGKLAAFFALSVVLPTAPAWACRNHAEVKPFFHEVAPPDEIGDFVAEVEIVTETTAQVRNTSTGEQPARSYEGRGLEARVLRHIRGNSSVEIVKISPEFVISSCWVVAKTGQSGILVGNTLSHEEDGVIVIEVIRGPSLQERRDSSMR